jgi:hypothetical protein
MGWTMSQYCIAGKAEQMPRLDPEIMLRRAWNIRVRIMFGSNSNTYLVTRGQPLMPEQT